MKPKVTVIVPVYNAENTLRRALDSIPVAKDTQIILLDDGSTDNSWQIALDWWRGNNSGLGSIIHRWEENKGVAAVLNLGLNLASGEYVVYLSSDDWFLTGFDHLLPYLDGENDLVYFDLEVNDGSVWHINSDNKRRYPGSVKFMRRDFIGDTRNQDKKWHEDVGFYFELLNKNPKEVFTNYVLKHYDSPREGSLTWQATHGGKE